MRTPTLLCAPAPNSPAIVEEQMNPVSLMLLWLFIINLGIAFGAGLYESRVMIPVWAETPRETWTQTGTQFWVYVTTIPLTVLTLANLVTAWRDGHPRRRWWLTAVFVVVAERVATFAYFIPAMIILQTSADLTDSQVATGLFR